MRPGGTGGGERPDWGLIRARVASLTGWTWEYIGAQLTLPRLYELERYWAAHPPVGDLVGAYLGYKAPSSTGLKPVPPGTPPPPGSGYGTLEELVADFRSLGGQVKQGN